MCGEMNLYTCNAGAAGKAVAGVRSVIAGKPRSGPVNDPCAMRSARKPDLILYLSSGCSEKGLLEKEDDR